MKSLKQLYKIGRGPSSSHTIGPTNAAKLFKEEHKDAKYFKAILYGSLALTGKGHFTDIALINEFNPYKVDVEFNLDIKDLKHPNTLKLIAIYDDKEISKTYYSIGGGDIQVEGESKPIYKEVYPHNSLADIYEFININKMSLVDYVKFYEDDDISSYLHIILDKMMSVIDDGLSKDGVLPGSLKVERKAKYIYESKSFDLSNKNIYAYAYASAEENASGSEIVTAPTCGSCGLLPSILRYSKETLKVSDDKLVEALMIAGLIGNLIKTNASISGAEAGCQAEIGAACAMASAAYCYLLDGSIAQIEQAAEVALEHHLGLTCDPIDGYVQIPCIERNAICALRAIDAAKLVMVINPQSSKISFDLVVRTMLKTGIAIDSNFKETSKGGLAKEYVIK